MKYEKGDIAIYKKPKQTFFEWLLGYKPNYSYLTSYKNQGEIDICYELKDGDKIKVIEHCGGIWIVKPVNFVLPENKTYTTNLSWFIEKNFEKV